MVLILWLHVTLYVEGRILGSLIRCPLVFCTFLAISDESCTHPRLSSFHVFDDGKFRLLLFPAPRLYSDTLLLVVNGCPYPLGFAPCLYLWLQVLVCVYNTVLLQAVGCRLLIPVPLVVGIVPSAALTTSATSSELQQILKSCQTHGGCPTMSYSN